MKRTRSIKAIALILVVVLVVVIISGCGKVEPSSIETTKVTDLLSTPRPNESIETGKETVLRNMDCKIPEPTVRIPIRTYFMYLPSKEGKRIKVISFAYKSKDDLFFNREATDENTNDRFENALLKLEWIEALKVRGRVFGHLVFARHATSNINTSKTTLDKHLFVYRCVDFTENGILKTILLDSTQTLTVPDWVLR